MSLKLPIDHIDVHYEPNLEQLSCPSVQEIMGEIDYEMDFAHSSAVVQGLFANEPAAHLFSSILSVLFKPNGP